MSDILSIKQEEKRSTATPTSLLGQRGELLAAEHLISQGYRLVVANFKAPVGRNGKGVQVTGEIDIVALDGETLCFVEVKTRRSAEFTPVITAVNLRKQRQITRTARVYRRLFGIRDMSYRFDVITVLMPQNTAPFVELKRGYWTDASFRKRRWDSDDHYREF